MKGKVLSSELQGGKTLYNTSFVSHALKNYCTVI